MTSYRFAKWDMLALDFAERIAKMSKEEVQVGACLVSPDNRQYAFGYNGKPRNIERFQQSYQDYYAKVRGEVVIHAELNAVLNAEVNIAGWSLYVTFHPCIQCAAFLLQKQLWSITCPQPDVESRWCQHQQDAKRLLMSMADNVYPFAKMPETHLVYELENNLSQMTDEKRANLLSKE